GVLGIGTINSFISLEGPLEEKSTFLLSGRALYYDAILNVIDKKSNIPRYNYFDVNSKLTYNLMNNNTISISLVYSNDNLYDSKATNNFNYDINWQNGAFSINWLRILNSSIFTNTSLSLVNYRFGTNLSDNQQNVSSSSFYTDSKLTDITLKNASELRLNSQNVAKAGMDLTFHVYDVLFSNYYSYALEQSQRVKEDFIEISFFVQNESNFDEILKMNIGARANYFVGQDNFQLEPRVSFAYSLTHYLTIKTAAAKTYQFIHLLTRNDKSLPTDLWYPSNEYMKPSESWQYILGLESNFNNNKYVLTIEGYYREMKHLYEFKNDANFNPQENLNDQVTEGVGEAYGIELFFHKRIGELKGWVGFTHSWTNRKFSEINDGNIYYPRYDRRHDLSLALTYEVSKNLNVGISWVYSNGERVTMPSGQYLFQDVGVNNNNTNINLSSAGRNGYMLPAYHKMDLNLTYSFSWNSYLLETYLNVYNIYNKNNVFSYYITYKDVNGAPTPIINQITMFPFLPTIGIKINL
nr:hypothetical protein [Melioribacteraceae bacterium]